MGFSSLIATSIMVIVLVAGMGSLFMMNSAGMSETKMAMHQQERKAEERGMTDIAFLNATYSSETNVTEAYAINYGEPLLRTELLNAYMDGKRVDISNLTVMNSGDAAKKLWATNEALLINVTGVLAGGNHAIKITTENGASASIIFGVT